MSDTPRVVPTSAPMLRGLAIGLVGALLALAFPAHAGFRQRLPAPLAGFGEALAESVARVQPLPAASAGFRYVFDPRTQVFERESALAAQLFVERAEPIGAGRWSLSLLHQYIAIETYDGHELGATDFGAWRFAGFRFAGVRLTLDAHAIVPNVTVGLTDDLEVSATLPILVSDFTFSSGPLTLDGSSVLLDASHDSASAVGPGDLVLRGKWRAASGPFGQLAAGLVLRLPTGSADDFQGTGTPEVTPALYWSSAPLLRRGPVSLDAHVNLGMLLATDDVDRSEGRWSVGLDAGISGWMALGAAVLARHPVTGLVAGPACTDAPSGLDTQCAAREIGMGRPPVSPAGLSTSRPDIIDLAVGMRFRLGSDRLLAVAHVVIPLNDDGFRAEAVPTVGLETTF